MLAQVPKALMMPVHIVQLVYYRTLAGFLRIKTPKRKTIDSRSFRKQQVIKDMVQWDAYRFLKNVHGSPGYFQKVCMMCLV